MKKYTRGEVKEFLKGINNGKVGFEVLGMSREDFYSAYHIGQVVDMGYCKAQIIHTSYSDFHGTENSWGCVQYKFIAGLKLVKMAVEDINAKVITRKQVTELYEQWIKDIEVYHRDRCFDEEELNSIINQAHRLGLDQFCKLKDYKVVEDFWYHLDEE